MIRAGLLAFALSSCGYVETGGGHLEVCVMCWSGTMTDSLHRPDDPFSDTPDKAPEE